MSEGSGPLVGEDGVPRCPWVGSPALLTYHDTEWGMPVRGEQAFFERLSLEGFQAGLSWRTILDKREHFREVFHDFDVDAVAALDDGDLERLMQDPGIVRNRAKIASARKNARAAVALRDEGGLERLIRGHKPDETPRPRTTTDLPTTSPESLALSKELKKKGFGFVGPTTMYALMQAVGLVDAHLLGCFRRGLSGEWADPTRPAR